MQQLAEGEQHPAVASAPGDTVALSVSQTAHVGHDLFVGHKEEVLVLKQLISAGVHTFHTTGQLRIAAQKGARHIHIVRPDGIVAAAISSFGGAGLFMEHIFPNGISQLADSRVAGLGAFQHHGAKGAAVVQRVKPADLLIDPRKAILMDGDDLIRMACHIVVHDLAAQEMPRLPHAVERNAQRISPAAKELAFHIGTQSNAVKASAPGDCPLRALNQLSHGACGEG